MRITLLLLLLASCNYDESKFSYLQVECYDSVGHLKYKNRQRSVVLTGVKKGEQPAYHKCVVTETSER